jgi:hypothetical protein
VLHGFNASNAPGIIANMTGSADPIDGREAHLAVMQQLVEMFPDVRVHARPRRVVLSSSFCRVGGGSQPTSYGWDHDMRR